MCRNETIGTRQFIIFSEVFTGLPAEHAKVVQVSELKDFGDLPSCVDIIVLKQVSMLEKINFAHTKFHAAFDILETKFKAVFRLSLR